MRVAMVLTSAALLLGCDRSIEEAQKIAADGLKDPAATQFRNVKKGSPGFVCGELNGKNSYGAYVGFKRFYVDTARVAHIEDDSSLFLADEWLSACDRERFPTAELRKQYTDSIAAAYESAVSAQRPGKEYLLGQLRRLREEPQHPILTEYLDLVIRMIEVSLLSNTFPAIGHEPTKVMHRRLCKGMVDNVGDWQLLVSGEDGIAKGYREATDAECTPY